MKNSMKKLGLSLLAAAAIPAVFSAVSHAAQPNEKPIWQQEVERDYPQQQPEAHRNSPLVQPAQQPAFDNQRRAPTYNPATEGEPIQRQELPQPTTAQQPQQDFVAPAGQNNDNPVDSDTNSNLVQNPDHDPNAPAVEGAANPADAAAEQQVESATPKWVETSIGKLKVLYKVYTRNKEITVKKGETAKLGALNIKLEKCFRNPESDKTETSALLLISETSTSQPTKELFHGWMFSSSPAISALEHPLYDVILLECEDEEKKPEPAPENKDTKDSKNNKKNEPKKDNKQKNKKTSG